jgi:fatty acid desaturase
VSGASRGSGKETGAVHDLSTAGSRADGTATSDRGRASAPASGSSNLDGGRFFHLMSGHLSHQIEHHLFPETPAHRYPEVAPKIQALCVKYGLFYNTGSLFRQYLTVMKRILTYTLPLRRALASPT